MKAGVAQGIARSGLAVAVLMAAVLMTTAPGALAAADTLQLTPGADAWVDSAAPTINHGTATNQKARLNIAETYVRFNLTAWQGLRIGTLKFSLTGLSGNMSPLRLSTTGTIWAETDVNWNTRPAVVTSLAAVPTIASGKATFDVKSVFPSGFIDKVSLSLRVWTPNDVLVVFGSRETSSTPRLTLEVASRTDTVDLPPTNDTWADSTATGTNYGTATTLYAASGVKKEAFLKFDLSAWSGRSYDSLKLRLPLTAPTGPSVSAYKVSTSWFESSLTWTNRPTGGTLLGTFDTALDVGTRTLDVSTAFASRTVEESTLAVRLVGNDVATMTFSSRESGSAPVMRLFPGTGGPPPPTPTPTPTPTTTPAPTPTPSGGPPLFYFNGHGTDHGVGMSQTGAKGRANAGQTYGQIVHAYYTGVTLATLPPEDQTIRVMLSSAFVPTPTEPARVVARSGTWQSGAFPGQVFPADTYLDMALQSGNWTAKVRNPSGAVVASVETTDLTMAPAEPTTLFYMKFRDSLRKYDLYRGSMRLRVNGAGIQSINIVDMDHYVQGVVPAEMIPSWPLEALKVQAIAARTYGAAKLKTTGFYDVVPTSANQVYGGVGLEFNKTNNATTGTTGIIVMAGDRIATTYFFDTAGGWTENSEYAWPTNSGAPGAIMQSMRGIHDVDANGVPYDVTAASYAWQSGQFTMAQLSNILSQDSRTNVGTITNLTYYRGVSGRLYKVTLQGTAGTKNVNGAIFKNAYNNNRATGSPALKSTMIYLTPVSP